MGPTTSFSSSTELDLTQGLQLKIGDVLKTIPRQTFRVPAMFAAPAADVCVISRLLEIHATTRLTQEAARRKIVDVLMDTCLGPNGYGLTGDTEVWWRGTADVPYRGRIDLTMGQYEGNDRQPLDSHGIVIETKKSGVTKGKEQLLTIAGSILRHRISIRRVFPVFAVLTDGLEYLFYVVDIDGTVYTNGEAVPMRLFGTLDVLIPSVNNVLRWFRYMVYIARWANPWFRRVPSQLSRYDRVQIMILRAHIVDEFRLGLIPHP